MSYVEKIRTSRPLIHHLTNWVTIYDCAQITRSLGALPIMAHAKEEVEDMVHISDALVLNIGTLTTDFVDAQILAAKKANKKGIPIVLDIVGCGATPFRTQKIKEILQQASMQIIKGNKGEISALHGSGAEVKGVESIRAAENMEHVVQELAKQFHCTIVATGEVDIIANEKDIYFCSAGDPIMGKVVGTGCMATSVLACFSAVKKNKDYFTSSCGAMEFYGQSAEKAVKKAAGPMDFKMKLLDEIDKAVNLQGL